MRTSFPKNLSLYRVVRMGEIIVLIESLFSEFASSLIVVLLTIHFTNKPSGLSYQPFEYWLHLDKKFAKFVYLFVL